MASKSGVCASSSSSSRSTRKHQAKEVACNDSKSPRENSPDRQLLATAEQMPAVPEIKPSNSAEVHGVLLDLSPMKKSKNDRLYFEGHLGHPTKRQIRIVGFSNAQHSALLALQQDKEPLALLGCEVKPGRQRDKDLEIILKNSCKIQRSPHNFDTEQCQPAKREHINLEDIKDLPNFVEITTTAKVISVHKPIMVAGGKTKQDIIIADATSTAPLTLWETDVDRLIEGNTYSFTNLLVRTFQGKKQLSAPKHAAIASDDDITDVASAESSDSDSDSSMTLKNAEIIAVPVFSSYTACLTCKAKVEPKSAKVGNCTKCTMPQRLDKCVKQLSAKVIIQAGTQQKTLQVFGPQLAEICRTPQDQVDIDAVLTAPPCNIKFNERQVITSVYWNA